MLTKKDRNAIDEWTEAYHDSERGKLENMDSQIYHTRDSLADLIQLLVEKDIIQLDDILNI